MKKNQLLFALAILSAGILAAAGEVQAQKVTIPKNMKAAIPRNKIPVENKIPFDFKKIINTDLFAEVINFSIIKVDPVNPATGALVKIEGVVRNAGTSNYTSNTNQQIALLYEQILGGETKLVARQPFKDLSVNTSVKVSYTRRWNKSDEFPPTYTLVISFDPDIYIDGNNNNDDSNTANNKLSKSGEAINALPFINR
jgi:hypothetical protein